MPILNHITKEHINKALLKIKVDGIQEKYYSKTYDLVDISGEIFPPKYVIALANNIAYGAEIETETFTSEEAVNYLRKEGYLVKMKKDYILTITATSITSTDKDFDINNIGGGDDYEPVDVCFIKSNGTTTKRNKKNNREKLSNQTLPRLSFQIFEDKIDKLSDAEKSEFPVCKYNSKSKMIKGIFKSTAEFKKYRNTIEQCVYENGKYTFVIYSWNIFSTLYFVQECLKRFGDNADKFILIYRKKESKDKTNAPDNETDIIGNSETEDQIPLNTILYGPPGTGKTYQTAIYAVALCKEKGDLEKVKSEAKSNYNKVYDEYQKLINSGQVVFTTFHQSYGYEDFIEGIKPKTTPSKDIIYEVCDGTFKQFCSTNNDDKSINKLFIIDEINRGNISKIFGELITLIEDDKREKSSVTLPYSGTQFTVPKNVYILGTMNTADRSIALMDTALRRRFTFIEMMPQPELFTQDIEGVSIQKLLKTINERIEYLFDREHTVGHAYFKKFIEGNGTIEEMKEVFKNKIIPLLQEYFYDDYEKIALVLGDDKFKSQKDRRFVIEKSVPPVFAGSNFDEGVKYDLNQKIWELSDDDFSARIKAIYEDGENATATITNGNE